MREKHTSPTERAERGYIRLAAAVRKELTRRLTSLPGMETADLATLVQTIDDAHWLEMRAHLFEKYLDDARKKLFCD